MHKKSIFARTSELSPYNIILLFGKNVQRTFVVRDLFCDERAKTSKKIKILIVKFSRRLCFWLWTYCGLKVSFLSDDIKENRLYPAKCHDHRFAGNIDIYKSYSRRESYGNTRKNDRLIIHNALTRLFRKTRTLFLQTKCNVRSAWRTHRKRPTRVSFWRFLFFRFVRLPVRPFT